MEPSPEDTQGEHKNPSKKGWLQRSVSIIKNPCPWILHIPYLAKQDGAERKKQSDQVLELIFFVANPIVELVSIVFDQLSSQHNKAPFLLLCLIMSVLATLISISEFVYKLIKERGAWRKEVSWQLWLHSHGFFPYIIALTCAFGQLIISTVNYSLYRKHGHAPVKISIWSTIFAFGQLVSLLSSRGAKTEVTVNQEPSQKKIKP